MEGSRYGREVSNGCDRNLRGVGRDTAGNRDSGHLCDTVDGSSQAEFPCFNGCFLSYVACRSRSLMQLDLLAALAKSHVTRLAGIGNMDLEWAFGLEWQI